MTELPKTWLGNWRGTLVIQPPLKNYPASLPMELRIKALGAGKWSWTIVYDGQPRPYELLATAQSDTYTLDEKNGITMEANLLGDDRLSCVFEVDGQLLLSHYQLLKDGGLRYEIRSYKRGAVTQPTGGTNKITSFRLVSTQSALLKR